MPASATTTPTASPAVLHDVSFTVDQGEVVALLGPDSTGKTTIIEAIAGRRVPDAGSVCVLGNDAAADRLRVEQPALGDAIVALTSRTLLTDADDGTRCPVPPLGGPGPMDGTGRGPAHEPLSPSAAPSG